MNTPQFLQTISVLPVGDIYDTLAWYEKALGYKTRHIHGSGRRGEERNFANYAIMERDSTVVHFIMDEEPDGPPGHWTRAGTGYLYIKVSDVDALYAEVRSCGIPIARELEKENWNARGFNLTDPSGNDIHIEQTVA